PPRPPPPPPFPTRRSSDLCSPVLPQSLPDPHGDTRRGDDRQHGQAGREERQRAVAVVGVVEELLPADVDRRLEAVVEPPERRCRDRKSTRLNSSHVSISYA